MTDDKAIDGAPAWSPDGKYLYFSSDRTGIFNIYAYELETKRLLQVTNVLGGAFSPGPSPDGKSVCLHVVQRQRAMTCTAVPVEPGFLESSRCLRRCLSRCSVRDPERSTSTAALQPAADTGPRASGCRGSITVTRAGRLRAS